MRGCACCGHLQSLVCLLAQVYRQPEDGWLLLSTWQHMVAMQLLGLTTSVIAPCDAYPHGDTAGCSMPVLRGLCGGYEAVCLSTLFNRRSASSIVCALASL